MTTAQKPIPGSALAKLMAVLRPEFRADVYVPAPNDPVFISDQCIVADCDRTALYNDPFFKIAWPLPLVAISEKDRNAQMLEKDFRGIQI